MINNLMGLQIVENPYHPKIPSPNGDTVTIRIPGHPFVRWLAKWIPFEPDILLIRPLMVDDPNMVMAGNKLICSPAQAKEIRNRMAGMSRRAQGSLDFYAGSIPV